MFLAMGENKNGVGRRLWLVYDRLGAREEEMEGCDAYCSKSRLEDEKGGKPMDEPVCLISFVLYTI